MAIGTQQYTLIQFFCQDRFAARMVAANGKFFRVGIEMVKLQRAHTSVVSADCASPTLVGNRLLLHNETVFVNGTGIAKCAPMASGTLVNNALAALTTNALLTIS